MPRQRVLVVEDNHEVREVLSLCLNEFYDVKQASTGVEALSIVRHKPVAVIVLDYRLPDCSGLEVLRELKSARPGVPVIMLTGYGSESVCASAFKLGISDYLAKPFNVFELLQTVRRVLGRDSSRSEKTSSGQNRDRWVESLPSREADLPIQKVAVLIQQRYWDHLTLSGLAREVGFSKYHLSHRFRESMGVTLRGYLLRVRLERAKELLAVKRTHITEVALAVGFSDLPHFDRLFKRYSGVTPSAYRDLASRNK